MANRLDVETVASHLNVANVANQISSGKKELTSTVLRRKGKSEKDVSFSSVPYSCFTRSSKLETSHPNLVQLQVVTLEGDRVSQYWDNFFVPLKEVK